MPSSHAPIPPSLERLRRILKDMPSVLVCFSGGIDSALVLAVATEQLGNAALGITAVSPSLPMSERLDAARIATELGAQHEIIETQEILRPGYAENGPDRCFHCKSELYEVAKRRQAELGHAFIVNGANTDDLGDYRPGLTAAAQNLIRAPLIEAEMNKADVRACAEALGMRIWDKPASACLSSRIPYGTRVTPERLKQVERMEAALKERGFSQVRVRWYPKEARIEVPLSALESLKGLGDELTLLGRGAGFDTVTIDPRGYRQGSLNEALGSRRLPVIT